MPGSQSIGAIGSYPYQNNADYSKYLAQVYSINPNALAFKGAADTQTTANQTSTQQVTRPVATTEKKKNGAAKVVLGTILTVGAGLTIYAACKGKGGENIFDNIGRGYKMIFSKAKDAVNNVINSEPAKRTVRKVGDKVVVELPGEKNVVSAVNRKGVTDALTKAKEELKALGENNVNFGNKVEDLFTSVTDKDGKVIGSKLTEGTVIDKMTFTIQHTPKKTTSKPDPKPVEYIVQWVDGKVARILDKNGKVVTDKVSKNSGITKKMQERANDIISGKVDLSTIENIHLHNTSKTGIVREFSVKKDGTPILRRFSTDRFSLDSTKVKALRQKDSSFKEALDKALKALKSGKSEDLNIASAKIERDVKATKKLGAFKGTFTIDGKGNIMSLEYNGRTLKPESDEFLALKDTYEDIFNGISNTKRKDYKDIVFELS